jgi:hypothetical protein
MFFVPTSYFVSFECSSPEDSYYSLVFMKGIFSGKISYRFLGSKAISWNVLIKNNSCDYSFVISKVAKSLSHFYIYRDSSLASLMHYSSKYAYYSVVICSVSTLQLAIPRSAILTSSLLGSIAPRCTLFLRSKQVGRASSSDLDPT